MLFDIIRETLNKSYLGASLKTPLLNVGWVLLFQKCFKLKNLCITVSLIPLCWIAIDIAFDNLGANPIQALHIRLGDWSLRFLCVTLAITPIQKITKWSGMANYRQLFGLYAFFYASLHVLSYLYIDHALAWSIIVTDVVESSYIWFGLFAYIIILLLAITSPKSAKNIAGQGMEKASPFYLPSIYCGDYSLFLAT
ncbi:sulfite oxidase heme-binding subunit YedZ [Methylocucumis oryzae]|uniref:sulfite oxidase heme-binding subunit YedZ n=1 Tax=Methylocucumis oryzae TaxID=1632867 RepID=UPI000AA6DB28|nr:ferric reductase-like transmembrane domain-containing protein [Methylocucumis oryzae]